MNRIIHVIRLSHPLIVVSLVRRCVVYRGCVANKPWMPRYFSSMVPTDKRPHQNIECAQIGDTHEDVKRG